ncbi:hypothetical protein G6735_04745 [Polynucleobacter paneuropaeus]|nr:hypothetical protein [Polynucleobacter paneuropaeus]
MSWIKKLFFYLILLLIVVLSIELVSYAANYIMVMRKPHGIFSIRDFTELVDDARFVTMKKDFSYVVSNGKDAWNIETDENRFRVPPRVDKDWRDKGDIFLFIGDSVPFGWGVDAQSSLPYLFQEKNKRKFNVINAAIPSYSLAQAVERLQVEFSSVKNISYIYLQIYDPVSQYAQYGTHWHESDNWTNASIRLKDTCSIVSTKSILYMSNFLRLANDIYLKFSKCSSFATQPNSESDQRFINHIKSQLKKASDFAHKKHAILIVAPLVRPPKASSPEYLPETYARATELLNNTFKNESFTYGYRFIDLTLLLNEDIDFIDLCCHLSLGGAQKVSNALQLNL